VISEENRKGLYGLVLAGGKSTRMGSDKTVMAWHGQEQRYYLADMLGELCEDVFISCRAEQTHDIDNNYKVLTDQVEGKGPLGAILTAFNAYPDKAWLVIASDLPLLDEDTITYLVNNRDPNCIATTFESPHDGLPEPLITIWEPAAFEAIQSLFQKNISCPRKVLMRNLEQVKIIKPNNPQALLNANTPDDAAQVIKLIQHNHS
jgi:molybdopterin-guanine dinucleotide biosynthesis protein A